MSRGQARFSDHNRTAIDLDMRSAAPMLFPPHIPRLLVLAKRHKTAVPEVAIIRPLDEFKLPHEHWCEPVTFAHLFRRQSGTPTPCLLLWQICERAFLGFQWLELSEEVGPRRRREAVAGPSRIHQLAVVVIADHERVEILERRCVAADHQFLSLIHAHLLPGAGALAGLIVALSAL